MGFLSDRRKTIAFLYYATALVHVCYLVIFAIEKIKFLVGFNAILCTCYVAIALASRKIDDLIKIIRAGTITMTVCLTTHFVLLGPDYEYQYLALSMIPLLYFSANVAGKDLKHARKMAFISFGVLVGVTLISWMVDYPVFEIKESSRKIIAYLNVAAAYAMAIHFMSMFVSKTDADVDALEDKNEDIEKSANIDALTGLRNRRTIEAYIKRALYMASGEGKDLSFLMCDIDNFKHINDTYGHDCGDQVLKNIASIIKSEIRPDDVAFRWGGEEILIVINGKEHVAKNVAERCRNSIENSSVMYNDMEIKVTITIGGSTYYRGATRDDLVNRADENLYKGKHNGKNQVVM